MGQSAEVDSGLHEMEGEHRIQVGLIMALERALADGKSKDELAEITDSLVDYTSVHFMSEQLLMRLNGYPDSDGHELEHDDLIERVRAIQSDMAGDGATSGVAALKDCLIDHIRRADSAFALYLNGAN